MEKIAHYQFDDDFPPKIVSVTAADSLTDLPTLIQPENNFVLLLVVDGTKVDSALIYSTAEKLLDKGMVYACVWGPNCEKIHDIIDEVIIHRNPDETKANVVTTTWHHRDTLAEAVWFFLNCAWPAEDYVHTCSDWVAAAIGNPSWEAEVRAALLAHKEESEST